MKKHSIYQQLSAAASCLLLAACGLVLTGCGSDSVEASPSEEDVWLHPYGASQSDQSLQTQFYQKNGIYLLFNDTIRKERVATNPDGTPYYDFETANLSYIMTGISNNYKEIFEFDYLQTDADKQAATRFIEDKVLPHLGGGLLPFSLLLVNKITFNVENSSTYGMIQKQTPMVYAGFRCTAIVTQGVADMDDATQKTYCNDILKSIVNSKVSALPANAFDEFYSYSNAYYSTYAMYEAAEAFFVDHPTPYSIGLLDGGYYRWSTEGSLIMYNIKAKNYDLEDYTNAVFTYTDAEFEALYGEYPICMRKFKLLKDIYQTLGLKF